MQRKGKTVRVGPVDEDHQVHEHPARAQMVALEDRNLFNQRIRSERSSAYWFAASLWGVSGLVLGAILGVYITLVVQTGSADIWRDNFISGQAARAAEQSVNSRESRLPGQRPEQPQQQP